METISEQLLLNTSKHWDIWKISVSNHTFRKAIWDKLPICIFENFEIALVKREQFQNLQKNHDGDLSQKSPEPNM